MKLSSELFILPEAKRQVSQSFTLPEGLLPVLNRLTPVGEQLVPEKISAKRFFVSLLVKLLGNLVTKSSFRVVGIPTIVSKC